MVSASMAARLADEFGPLVDETRVHAAFDDIPDSEAVRVLEDLQTGGVRERFASSVGRTPERFAEVAADQPSRISGQITSGTQRTLLGLGAVGGATAVGFPLAEGFREQQEASQQQAQSETLQSILSDPHLSDSERQSLIDDLIGQGFFSGAGGGDGGGGPLAGLFSGIGLGETVFILIIVWFLGRALVEAAGDSGGS